MADFKTVDTPPSNVGEQGDDFEEEGQRMIELKHSEPGIKTNSSIHQVN